MSHCPTALARLAWPDIAAHLESSAGLVLLPIGATEQHGKHLPVSTDTLIAERVALAAAARAETAVLPALPYSVSIGHTAKWPGTFSLSHQTFAGVIGDITAWCVATGWRKLLFINSHFGNDASLRASIERLRLAHLGTLQIGLVNTFALTPSIWQYFTSDAEDLHANKAETDLILHLEPDTVRMDRAEDDPDRTGGAVFSYPVSQTSLDGLTGNPTEGTAGRGARLFEEMVTALAATIERAKTEEPPLAAERWSGIPTPS